MGYTCAVRDCRNSARVRPRVMGHNMPRDETKFKIWCHQIQREDLLARTPKQRSNLCVCDVHFADEDKFVMVRNRTNLKVGSIPKCNLPPRLELDEENGENISEHLSEPMEVLPQASILASILTECTSKRDTTKRLGSSQQLGSIMIPKTDSPIRFRTVPCKRIGMASIAIHEGKTPSPITREVNIKWSMMQCAFAVEMYFSQSQSIAAVQRAFRTRYKIPSSQAVPNEDSIMLWVKNFRETGSISRK